MSQYLFLHIPKLYQYINPSLIYYNEKQRERFQNTVPMLQIECRAPARSKRLTVFLLFEFFQTAIRRQLKIAQLLTYFNLIPSVQVSIHHFFIGDGSYQTDCPQVHSSEGAPQTACCPENCQKISPHRFWRQEASPIQTWNSCPQIDQKIPKERKT